jgi:hypothetical protein
VFARNEAVTTAAAIVFSLGILYRREPGELTLFALGVSLGLVIEVGLGMIFRMQHWDNASLWGVPVWLPIIWGFGFVAIRRIGNAVVAMAHS